MIPEDLKYTRDHEWVKMEGGEAVIGITEHAQKELGDITFVELPETGADVSKGDGFATIESVKAASDVYAPVSGKVSAVNEELESSPELINRYPYGQGWICKINVDGDPGAEGLMDAEAYAQFLEENEQ
ncbi:MAG: glycine cleavage system protein GcvH [Candidatus Omnitrophica bacterium]|nr:glycine cleavage system protein GcvH [Candidatus Omnitrophota bacterium]